jgi:hypothetical protein
MLFLYAIVNGAKIVSFCQFDLRFILLTNTFVNVNKHLIIRLIYFMIK